MLSNEEFKTTAAFSAPVQTLLKRGPTDWKDGSIGKAVPHKHENQSFEP